MGYSNILIVKLYKIAYKFNIRVVIKIILNKKLESVFYKFCISTQNFYITT